MIDRRRTRHANADPRSRGRQLILLAAIALGTMTADVTAQDTFVDLFSTVAAKPAKKKTAEQQQAEKKIASDEIAARRKDLAERLLVAQKQLETTTDGTTPEPSAKSSREVELLKELDLLYSQQQSAADRQKELKTTEEGLIQRMDVVRRDGPPGERPYSFLLLDELEGSLTLEQERALSLTAAVENAKESLRVANEAVDRAEARRRQAKEALDAQKQEAERAELAEKLRVAEMEAKISKQKVVLAKLELANAEEDEQVAKLRREFIDLQISLVRADVRFSQEDLDQKLLEIEKRESEINSKLQSAESLLPFLERKWGDVRSQLEAAVESDPVLLAEVDARQLNHQTQQQKITILKQQLERLAKQREAWNRRFRVYHEKEKRSVLRLWAEEASLAIADLQRKRLLEDLQIGELRNAIGELDKRLQGAADRSDDEIHWIKDQQEARRKQIIERSQNLVSIDATARVFQKLYDDIRIDTENFSFGATAESVWAQVVAIWNYEIATTDDQSITVGKIIGVLLLLAFGLWLSRMLSRMFGRRLLPRVGVNESAASALQSIAFYLLVTVSALTALRLVNVPLTVFTVLGGAVAIGVGFGSQNIMNNFISGLILLAERPIRVGDMIEVSGVFGTVEMIGARSTRVRTGENFEIIVPNSSFLENQVVNWTLTDSMVRCCVPIGVAYGSPTRDVARWLRKAAEEHGLVQDRPEPFVWFTDFGDNSLMFQLHFWVTVRTASERRRIESDLRFMIDQNFREAGIVIAFPQRDVHLDTLKPLEIRMLPQESPPGNPAATRRGAADSKNAA